MAFEWIQICYGYQNDLTWLCMIVGLLNSELYVSYFNIFFSLDFLLVVAAVARKICVVRIRIIY